MARRPSTRVVLNRASLDQVDVAVADGLSAVSAAVLVDADPPDQTPYGVGLVRNGGYLTYVRDKKVGGFGLDGRQPRKPRAVRVKDSTDLQTIVGYGFPGRFQQLGTLRQPAQPFIHVPSRPHIVSILQAVVPLRLRAIRP